MRKHPAPYGHYSRIRLLKTTCYSLFFCSLAIFSVPQALKAAGNAGDETELRADIPVKGKVVDQVSGEPIAGVSVIVKGTSKGTTTDAEGNYSLSAPENGVLQFTVVGYGTIEMKVNNTGVINVSLN